MFFILVDNSLIMVVAGGYGNRIWPLSRSDYPKQFYNLTGDEKTLFQKTLLRAINLKPKKILICANYEQRYALLDQLSKVNLLDRYRNGDIDIIFEPESKNTMPSAVISALVAKKYNITNITLFPSDHIIENEDTLYYLLNKANNFINSNNGIVTIGIKPQFSNCEYGYLKKSEVSVSDDICKIDDFIEKPSVDIAQELIRTRKYLWNSGIFLYNVDFMLNEASFLEPELYNNTQLAYQNMKEIDKFITLDSYFFSKIQANSIDYSILEKTAKKFVIDGTSLIWHDLGSFESIYNIQKQDINNNVKTGDNIYLHNVNSSHIINQSNRTIIASNIKNILAIAMNDVVTICDRTKPDIKAILQNFDLSNTDIIRNHNFTYRAWGSYEIIWQASGFKIKKITMRPNCAFSYQMHKKRSEHWIVISGSGIVTLEGVESVLHQNQSFFVPQDAKHKIANNTENDLILIEIQCGSYLNEDDIVRFEH